MYPWICARAHNNLNHKDECEWKDELHKQQSCCYISFHCLLQQIDFAVTVSKKCLNLPLMCDHVIELGTESPGMCFGAAADEMMLGWDDVGDKICGA